MFKRGETTNVIQQARIRKTKYFFEDRENFLKDLEADITKAIKMAKKHGLTPAFRLNGTSDISWEKYGIIQKFPDIQFYDYTKVRNRKVSHLHNYHLTFSAADGNDSDVHWAIKQGMNVATVFAKSLPSQWYGLRVIDADDHDLRFLDSKGSICGLVAKGKAKKDTTGFVKVLWV